MENFEELSNEQLRLKLLEYGMANMPVTQTTRKVLIKKLKNHLESANTKVRRETIHVAKYSSDEDTDTGSGEGAKKTAAAKKETNRRATIGGSAAKLSKTLPVMPNLPPPKPASAVVEKVDPAHKRRSGRITPVQLKDDVPAAAAAPKEPMIVENSDEDEDMIPLTQVTSRRLDRKSKSPSLSRAEMVTTSYIHEVEVSSKPGGIVEEMEIDLTESTDDVIIESPVPEPVPAKTRPPTTPSRETRHSSNITTTTTKRTTIGGAPSAGIYTKDPYAGRPSLSTTSYTSSYNPPAAREPQTSTNRPEPASGGIDSPYLSEFTKRLSRLKAESAQLNAAREHPIRRTIAGSSYAASPRGGDGEYVSSRYSAVGGRQQLRTMDSNGGGGKGEIRSSLRQVIVALDQKYSFKKMFYVLIIMLIVIFLFVFFFL